MDYSNGKIYCIRNNISDDIYIGSTCQKLCQRLAKHKSQLNNNKKKHRMLYDKMNELGKENFYIELLLDFPCENKDQLRAKEGEYIREMANLNHAVAGRNQKDWYEENKERILEHIKEYREENKELINERVKRYVANNKDKILENKKQYYIKNKERMNKNNRENYYKNREYYLNYWKEKVKCECGMEITKCNLTRHKKISTTSTSIRKSQ